MDIENPPPEQEASRSSNRSGRRPAALGAIVGVAALTAAVIGVSAVAGASSDDDPSLAERTALVAAVGDPAEASPAGGDASGTSMLSPFDDEFRAHSDCMTEQLGDRWLMPMAPEIELDPDGVEPFEFDEDAERRYREADETCFPLLPLEVRESIEAMQPYEDCLDDALAGVEDPFLDGDELTDADWEAYDEAFRAAEEGCRDELPEDVRAEFEAIDAFHDCLEENGAFDDAGFAATPMVHIETGDGFQVAEFGEVEGSVTISGTADGLFVEAEGGVILLDEGAMEEQFEALDAAHEACEALLPETDGFGFAGPGVVGPMFDIEVEGPIG